MAKKHHNTNTIAQNKKARFDYFIEERIEAGVVLQGWEVKSLRAGRVQLAEAYVLLKDGEAWLIGAFRRPHDRTRGLPPSRIGRLSVIRQQAGITLGDMKDDPACFE